MNATVHSIPTTTTVDVPRLVAAYRELLLAIGEDPDRDGLRDTPRRAAAFWTEFLDAQTADRLATTFTHHGDGDSYVLVRGIDCWTMCEHHLLPFRLTVAAAYLPSGGQLLGLSKLARIVAHHAARLQLQERLCDAIADHLIACSGSPDVGVWAEGEHLCMSMRGVRATAARTVTETLRGRLGTNTAIAMRLMAAAGIGSTAR